MMLHETRMLREPQRVSWAHGQSLCLYGDPSYRLGVHLVQTAFRDAHLIPQRQLYNQAMSEVRASVERIFGNVWGILLSQDPLLSLVILLGFLGILFLQIAHTCVY